MIKKSFKTILFKLSPEYFPNTSRGRALSSADIYVGKPDLDPEIVANQKTISVLQEDSTVVEVTQPIHTNAGGIVQYAGSPVTLLVDGDYSLKVLDSHGVQIYYVPSVLYYTPLTTPYARYYPDYTEVDQGAAGGGNSVYDILAEVGAVTEATIYFAHNSGSDTTTYTFTTDETITDNFNIIIERGAILSIDTGVTLTINGPFSAGFYQVFSGDGSVVFDGEVTQIGYVEWYGIDGTADEVELNKIAASGVKTVELLAKTYTCNAQFTVPKHINLIGQGIENTILDFDAASGAFADASCIYNAGDGLVSLGALSADITKGSKTVTCPSSPSVVAGDVIVIYDSADYSYSAWKAEYRAGEYGIVASISGNDIILVHGTFAAYTTGGTRIVYKLSNPSRSQFKDFQIKGNVTGATALNALKIRYGRDNIVSNIKIPDSYYTGLSITQCFNTGVEYVDSSITALHHASGTVYPFVIANSQEITLDHVSGWSPWHVISPGGGDYIGCVPNRHLLIQNGNLKVTAGAPALVFHGNTEHSGVDNCVVDGIILSGNHIYASNNIVTMDGLFYAIDITEPSGFDYSITRNIAYILTSPAHLRGAFFNVGGNGICLSDKTTSGGTLTISENKAYYGVSDDEISAIVIRNRGCTQTNLRVVCNDNQIIGTYSSRGHDYGIKVDVVSGAAFADIRVENNLFYSFGVSVQGAVSVDVLNNTIENAGTSGIVIEEGSVISETPDVFTVSNNIVKKSRLTGIFIKGNNAEGVLKAYVTNNVSIENIRATTGVATTNVNLHIQKVKDVYSYQNLCGSAEAAQVYPAYYYTLTNLYENRNEFYGTGAAIYDTVTNQWGNIQTHVSDPSGGGTIDAESRTAINSILDILENMKLMSP